MRVLLVGFAIVAMTSAWSHETLDMEQIIMEVNNANTTWTAGHNFAPDTPINFFRKLASAKIGSNRPALAKKSYSGTPIPDEFDARKEWPNCPTISHIIDQGGCGSCWAVSAASAFSDRVCIASNSTFTLPLSGGELMSCAPAPSWSGGCRGGIPEDAWDEINKHGLPTGGDYHSGVGCQPYPKPPCEHHVPGPRPKCHEDDETPPCLNKCTNPKYPKSINQDRHKAGDVYAFDTLSVVQEDIMNFGPLSTGFAVYADFMAYKSGVYQHVSGKRLGGHAVRVIGWGTENGTPYWLVANSWNSDWGDNGTFKILRGQDECGFEDGFVTARVLATS